MKKLVVFLVVALMSVSTFADNTKPTSEIKSELRSEIVKLLGKVDFEFNNNLETSVEFFINNKGEVVVLTVNSNNTNVSNYVKNKLNYRVVTKKSSVKGKVYKMPLKIVKK